MCSICFEQLENGKLCVEIYDCEHSFHKECIESSQELCRKGEIRTGNEIIWCNNDLCFNSELLTFSHEK